jgi:hypothetical protein
MYAEWVVSYYLAAVLGRIRSTHMMRVCSVDRSSDRTYQEGTVGGRPTVYRVHWRSDDRTATYYSVITHSHHHNSAAPVGIFLLFFINLS